MERSQRNIIDPPLLNKSIKLNTMAFNPAQDIMTHPEDARQIRLMREQIETMRDFIGWIFDNPDDEGIHWMSESEAWELFHKWEEKTYPEFKLTPTTINP